MSDVEEFAKALSKDPTLLTRLQKTSELTDFKEKYNAERATPLKCPVCSLFYQYPGSLWVNRTDHTKFVCKKCRLEFTLICLTLDNDILIDNMRKAAKGELTETNWMPGGKNE